MTKEQRDQDLGSAEMANEIVTLLDEDEIPHDFQVIDVFDVDGKRYVALESLDNLETEEWDEDLDGDEEEDEDEDWEDEELDDVLTEEDEDEDLEEEEEEDFPEDDEDELSLDPVTEIRLLRYDKDEKGEEILVDITDESEFERVRQEFERRLDEE